MSIVWLVILLIYGFCTHWNIDPLFWWLLFVFAGQDAWDVQHKRAR